MNLDSLAVLIALDGESSNISIRVLQHVYQTLRDVVTLNSTLEKVSVIKISTNVLQNEIKHHLDQHNVVLLFSSFSSRGMVIFSVISSIYKQRLVEFKDTYYCRNTASNTNFGALKFPFYCKRLSCDNDSVFCMPQLYIINIDTEVYVDSLTTILNSIPFTRRMFFKKLYVSEGVYCPDLNLSNVEVKDNKITISGNSLKSVNSLETCVLEKLSMEKLPVTKRLFVDDFMDQIIKSDEPHIQKAVSVITECLNNHPSHTTFLCFNGGKDCTVLLHLLLAVLRHRSAPNQTLSANHTHLPTNKTNSGHNNHSPLSTNQTHLPTNETNSSPNNHTPLSTNQTHLPTNETNSSPNHAPTSSNQTLPISTNQTKTNQLLCLYVEHHNPFTEVSDFVRDMTQYYGLEVVTERRAIKESLADMLGKRKGLRACFMGTRRTDPYSADLDHFQMTDPGWPQVLRVSPLLDWHYSQIWEYLRTYQVPYCCLYDQGYTSLGNIVNTVPNDALRYRNISKNEMSYMPAYKLLDGSLERSGRITNVS